MWIVFLSHYGTCASVNDSMRIRTDTTLDQDCIMEATVFVCTSCTVCLKATVRKCTTCIDVSWLTTCMNLNRNRRQRKTKNKGILSATWGQNRNELPTLASQPMDEQSVAVVKKHIVEQIIESSFFMDKGSRGISQADRSKLR